LVKVHEFEAKKEYIGKLEHSTKDGLASSIPLSQSPNPRIPRSLEEITKKSSVNADSFVENVQ
jgi:hypothetical protein